MLRNLFEDERGQMAGPDLPGVILMIGIAVVVGFVVLFLSSEVISQTSLSSGEPLYNASQDLQTATDSAFGMFGLLFTIVILAVAVIYLYAIRGRR